MSAAHAIRQRFVEGPRSLGERSRAKRWRLFQRLFPQVTEWRIIDLGGVPETWFRAPVKPKHVTVVNVSPLEAPSEPWLQVEQEDACVLSDRIRSQPFDLVFSNSLIEHVGGDARCRDLAENIHRLAPRHWVQTPYRYFPVEPHWLFPGLQFLPVRARDDRSSLATRQPRGERGACPAPRAQHCAVEPHRDAPLLPPLADPS